MEGEVSGRLKINYVGIRILFTIPLITASISTALFMTSKQRRTVGVKWQEREEEVRMKDFLQDDDFMN